MPSRLPGSHAQHVRHVKPRSCSPVCAVGWRGVSRSRGWSVCRATAFDVQSRASRARRRWTRVASGQEGDRHGGLSREDSAEPEASSRLVTHLRHVPIDASTVEVAQVTCADGLFLKHASKIVPNDQSGGPRTVPRGGRRPLSATAPRLDRAPRSAVEAAAEAVGVAQGGSDAVPHVVDPARRAVHAQLAGHWSRRRRAVVVGPRWTGSRPSPREMPGCQARSAAGVARVRSG